jgi:hypothetical protein
MNVIIFLSYVNLNNFSTTLPLYPYILISLYPYTHQIVHYTIIPIKLFIIPLYPLNCSLYPLNIIPLKHYTH